ncbi:MAG: hypothetical protein Q7U66_06185 [Methylobacter sp.]|nr:hypothetical protein [Methylobacter sp.]
MNNLDLIFKTYKSGAELSPNLKHWLCGAIQKYKHGLPLDRAFDVSKQRKIQQRNSFIRLYANAIDDDSAWNKAETILSQLKKLRCGRHCSPLLVEADRLHRVPMSQRQIFRIITDS